MDAPADANVLGTSLKVAGWALDPLGIKSVEVRIDGKPHAANYGLPRPDVAAAKPDVAGAAHSGFSFEGSFPDLSLQRHEVAVVAINTAGTATTLGRRSLVPPAAMKLWSADLDAHPELADNRFYFLMLTSGVTLGGATEIETQYAGLTSRTQNVGMSVPILYLRTTKGPTGDWVFDPDFDLSRTCRNHLVAEDNLSGVIGYAIKNHIPVNFNLNGGIWADASCYSLDWDLTTHLELDPDNCQWDNHDVVLPGDYKKGLHGSTDSPELSRSLTYHVFDRKVRAYKKRNLQAAARIVAAFAREHPDLFVGVNLDADTYMNPFVREGRRYDYNPGMLRQFRDWLAGTGPYAGKPEDGAPDLRVYRRRHPLSLAEVNRLAGKHWTAWKEVDPPRYFPGDDAQPVKLGETPFWQDPWYQEWDVFRKHIVQLHYAELAQWTHEAGVPADRIFTAQAFTAHDPGMRPLSTYVAGASPDYDSAGVSVEGAMPRVGHLGAILYGPSAENAVSMETGHNLFATIARFDPAWGIVEANATDLKHADIHPTYAQSYRSFRDLFNYGGRQVALMAWNGSNGLFATEPDYVTFTAWRNTPAEQAMMDFMVNHADVPTGSLLWTFGANGYADDDGWTAVHGKVIATPAGLTFEAPGNRVTLRSSTDLVIRPARIATLFLRFDGPDNVQVGVISARAQGDDRWHVIARGAGTEYRLDWPAEWMRGETIVQEVELELAFAPGSPPPRMTRLLLYPSAAAARH